MGRSRPLTQRLTRDVERASALSAIESAKTSWRFSRASPAWVMNRRAVSACFPAVGAQAAIVDLGEVLLGPAQHFLDLLGRLDVVGRVAGAQQRRRRRRPRRPARRLRRAPVADPRRPSRRRDRAAGWRHGPAATPAAGPAWPGASATGCGRSSGTTTGPTIRGGTLGTARGTGGGAAAITFLVHPVAVSDSAATTTAVGQPARDGVIRIGTGRLIGKRRAMAGHVSSDVRLPVAAGW